MQETEIIGPQYIGQAVSITTLREWILDTKLTENDTVLLHPYTFDDIVLEYRATYGKSIPARYFLLGVLVEESTQIPVPQDRVVVLQNDTRPTRLTSSTILLPTFDDGRLLYRCGYCGNVVNSGGSLLDVDEKEVLINWLSSRRSNESVRTVHGACCPGGKVVHE
jgi:hypothetical protein